MHKTIAALVTVGLALLSLTACADAGSASGDGDGQTIEITFSGDAVEPNGERVEVDADEPIVLEITADAPGTLHVHSTPEQEISYDEGTSTHTLDLGKPGVVDVESHELEVTVVQLQAS